MFFFIYFITLFTLTLSRPQWFQHNTTTTTTAARKPIPLVNTIRMYSEKSNMKLTKNDHLVQHIPLLSFDFKTPSYSGYLPVSSNTNGAKLFYWYFESSAKSTSDENTLPIIIWLNGGPGCSSLEGLFSENGPFRLSANQNQIELKNNPYSWHNLAHIVYVDQPVGTGYSYVTSDDDYAKSENTIDENFYTFLNNFFTIHSDLTYDKHGVRRTVPIYIAGESYAGRYIPTISAYILQQNEKSKSALYMDLTGIAIGNGWTNPRIQYDYAEFALGAGLISQEQAEILRAQYELCLTELDNGKTYTDVCSSIFSSLLDQASVAGGYALNMYDIRLYQKSTDVWPEPSKYLSEYLNRRDVREALHADNFDWEFTECSDAVYDHLMQEDGVSSLPALTKVLESKVHVLFYNGQFDLTCHHLGIDKMLRQLPWSGLQNYLNAPRAIWSLDSKPVGYVTQTANRALTSIVVLGASHMVPYDQPAASFDMISRFLRNRYFGDYEQTFMLTTMNEVVQQTEEKVMKKQMKQVVMQMQESPSIDVPSAAVDEQNDKLNMWTYVITFLLLVAFVFVVYKKRIFYRRDYTSETLPLRSIFEDIPKPQ